MNACDVPQCTGKHCGLGLCKKHYARRRRMGAEHFEKFGRYNTPDEKFWLRVDKSGDCWTWIPPLNADGYGVIQVHYVEWKAHRFAFTLTHGSIKDGMEIDHLCHNRACVRPSHLREVTDKQNAENRIGAVSSRSKTGIRGVYPIKGTNRYRVSVGHNGKLHDGGRYESLEQAAEAAKQLRLELFTHSEADRDNVMAERAKQNQANAARRLAA